MLLVSAGLLLMSHLRKRTRCSNLSPHIDERTFHHNKVKPKKCGKRHANRTRSEIVTEPTVADATGRIYESLQANNADIDVHIAAKYC
ncbi:hypothetical protein F4V90_05680 [Neorhizobium galegae]|nr:hypothetical protein F4V90_05680 [Neorhizobium galegae]